jgi:uncharacterized membrane protein
MKKSMLLLIIGIVMIVVAVAILGVFYAQGIAHKEVVNVGSNESKNVFLNFADGENYTIFLSSTTNISYELLSPSGSVLYKGNNINSAVLNITHAQGKYELTLKNNGNSSADVSIVISKESNMEGALYGIYVSGGICLIGLIISIVALIILLWNRKMEERQYRRY